MKHRRTHRRKHHSKRKTSRRTHRRRTHRRRGGASWVCQAEYDKLVGLRNRLQYQNAESIEDYIGEIRALYDEAERKDCGKGILKEIEEFENGPAMAKANSLLRV
jgi:hypothetical protein